MVPWPLQKPCVVRRADRPEYMSDWCSLRHAYGPAGDVPALLAQMSPDVSAPVWQALWSCLCHQGTVYSASYAALPELESAARCWPPAARLAPLALASGIVAATDVNGGRREQYLSGLGSTIDSLRHLAVESLRRPGWTRSDVVYLLQAVAAFDGDRLWGNCLDYLVDGELPGQCSACSTDLYLVIGESGFFTAVDGGENRPETLRVPIEPASGALPPASRRLNELAAAAGHADLASWMLYLFGSSRCPNCDVPFTVPDAVVRAIEPSAP
jgi:hypothetical protein